MQCALVSAQVGGESVGQVTLEQFNMFDLLPEDHEAALRSSPSWWPLVNG